MAPLAERRLNGTTERDQIMRKIVHAACLAIVAGTFTPAQARQAQGTEATSQPVTPEIRQALERMAEALKAMNNFEIKADMTSEEVLESGQKVESSGVLTIAARRPDRLYIELASERRMRQFYYDGKQVTIYGPKTGYYATVAAPPTTHQLLDELSNRYGVETPLADLFEWGASGVKLDKVQSGFYAGPDRIQGQACDHYAFRQESVDWQLWIRREGQPLPCKIVMTNTDDASQPQTAAIFNWVAGQTMADSRFRFTPPANAHRIQLTPVAASGADGGQP